MSTPYIVLFSAKAQQTLESIPRGGLIGRLIVNALSRPELITASEAVPSPGDRRWRVIDVAGYYIYFRFADPQRQEGDSLRVVGEIVDCKLKGDTLDFVADLGGRAA